VAEIRKLCRNIPLEEKQGGVTKTPEARKREVYFFYSSEKDMRPHIVCFERNAFQGKAGMEVKKHPKPELAKLVVTVDLGRTCISTL